MAGGVSKNRRGGAWLKDMPPPPPKIDMAIMENHHFSWEIHLQTVGFSIVMLIFRGVSFFSFETDMVTMDLLQIGAKTGPNMPVCFLKSCFCANLAGEILKIWGPTSERPKMLQRIPMNHNCYKISTSSPPKKNMLQN